MATSKPVPGNQTEWPASDLNSMRDAVVELQGVANGGSIPVIPEAYGAVGNGTTDDTAALILWAASGKNLALTPGSTYLHRRMISAATSGITIDGRGGTLKRAAQVVTTTATTITSGVTTSITLASVVGLQVGDVIVVEKGGDYDLPSNIIGGRVVQSIVGNVVTVTTAFGISLSGTTNVYTTLTQLYVIGHNVRITNLTLDGNSANVTWARWANTCGLCYGDNVTAWENGLIDHCRFVNMAGDSCAPTGISGCEVAFCEFTGVKGRLTWAGSNTPGNNVGSRCVFNRFVNCNSDTTVMWSNAAGVSGDGNGAINMSTGVIDLLVMGNTIDTALVGIGSINSTNNSNVTIVNNVIRSCSSNAIEGTLVNVSPATQNILIEGNRIYSCGLVQLKAVSAASTATGWIVRGNTFFETALNVENFNQFVVEDNWFYSATVSSGAATFITLGNNGAAPGQGIIARNQFIGGKFGILGNTGVNQVLISDNQFIGQYDTAILTQGASPYISILNNHCYAVAASKNGWAGISVAGAGTEIRGNTVDCTNGGGSGGGINIRVAANNCVVSNNISKQGAKTDAVLAIIAGATNCVVKDNIVDKNISDSGTGTTKAGNIENGAASTNISSGRAVLVAGTVTVSTSEVRTADSVLLTCVLVGGTQGSLSVGTIVNHTSFVINSSNAADTSTVYWEIRH